MCGQGYRTVQGNMKFKIKIRLCFLIWSVNSKAINKVKGTHATLSNYTVELFPLVSAVPAAYLNI